MKRTTILFFFALTFCFACDISQPSGGDPALQAPHAEFTVKNTHQGWEERIIIHSGGRMDFERLEGEELPPASVDLSSLETSFLNKLFDNFYDLDEDYTASTGSTLYTITYHGNHGEKTVTADNFIISHNLDDPGFRKMRVLVKIMLDYRMGMYALGRYGDKLQYDLDVENQVVGLDEPVKLKYGVRNLTGEGVVLNFANIQQLGYKVFGNGELLNEIPFIVQPATSSWTIPAGSTEQQLLLWDHNYMDDSGFWDRKVKSGIYTVFHFLVDGNSPVAAHQITITEQGEGQLDTRITRDLSSMPVTFTFDLNNRVSSSFAFDFSTNRKAGIKISHYDQEAGGRGEVVYTDTSGIPGHHQLHIEPFGDLFLKETWDGTDLDGNPLPHGFYWVEMWLLDQENDYRAARRFYFSMGSLSGE